MYKCNLLQLRIRHSGNTDDEDKTDLHGFFLIIHKQIRVNLIKPVLSVFLICYKRLCWSNLSKLK